VGRVLINQPSSEQASGSAPAQPKNQRVRVLIVDDSATMRRLIRTGIAADPLIEVIGEAGSAREARDLIKAARPDVMTLDIEMPGMDGLEFLTRLMAVHPMPVIMLSTLTAKGSDAAVQALAIGALDCVEKPRFGATAHTFSELAAKVKIAAEARVDRPRVSISPPRRQIRDGKPWQWNGKWVLIGASTGGVEALETILRSFPDDCPPTLITQHMPAQFLLSFAARLDASMAPEVRVAREGDRPRRGLVLIAPGGDTHLVLDPDDDLLHLQSGPRRTGHRPSVDEMMFSAKRVGARLVAVILTGMGRDGAEGMRALRQAGAICLGQDEATSIVYGMPRVAFEIDGVSQQLPLGRIAEQILRETST